MTVMLARQLVIGFLAVIVPSTLLLGSVTVYSLISLDRVSRDLVEIMRSRGAVTDLRLTLARRAPRWERFSSGASRATASASSR
jgi:CHASE3 domain sensor protein